jgi:6-phosphogluconate dehydrogenase
MAEKKYDIGMIGLGVMGRNLALNMADHGYSVVGYDKDASQVETLLKESDSRDVRGAESLKDLFHSLRKPRAVMILVPAGPPVDAVLRDLMPHLGRGDLAIDSGNSHFKDTNRRSEMLAKRGIQYLGVGISGGELGARHGPSIMPGGPQDAFERVRPLFEAVAAKAGDEPCVTWLGPGSAGHYVKMVHNGIEYGLMQLIAETYDLMRRGLGLTDDELGEVYDQWNQGELNSYLVEITAHIFRHVDEKTGRRLIDLILDEAKQKGTGMWTLQEAIDLQVPVPTIDMAVAMRDLSVAKGEREAASRILDWPAHVFEGDRATLLHQLRSALYAAMIVAYAQGMTQLQHASQTYGYHLNLEDIARIWRGGCIIRSALLEEIRAAYHSEPDLPNLLDSRLGKEVVARRLDLRAVICAATQVGVPAPGLMVSLAYLDAYRSAWLPANLIEAQRDYFGAHTYERVDAEGVFHTHWKGE